MERLNTASSGDTKVWLNIHRASERLAAKAELAIRSNRLREARDLYYRAASLETAALMFAGKNSPRMTGILAVSAAALYTKARRPKEALWLSLILLPDQSLPLFAKQQLTELKEINSSTSKKAS